MKSAGAVDDVIVLGAIAAGVHNYITSQTEALSSMWS